MLYTCIRIKNMHIMGHVVKMKFEIVIGKIDKLF